MRKLLEITICFLAITCVWSGEIIDGYYVVDRDEAIELAFTEGDISQYIERDEKNQFNFRYYKEVEAIVEEIRTKIQKRFPETEFPKIHTIMTHQRDVSSSMGGALLKDMNSYSSNYIKVIYSDFMFLPKSELYGLIAHELSHFALKHSTKNTTGGTEENVVTAFYKEEGDDCISCSLDYEYDSSLTDNFKELISAINEFGSTFNIDTGNIPIRIFNEDGELAKVVDFMLEKNKPKNASCRRAYDTYNFDLKASLINSLANRAKLRIDQPFILENIKKFKREARECFNDDFDLLMESLKEFLRIDFVKTSKRYLKIDGKTVSLSVRVKELFSMIERRDHPFDILTKILTITRKNISDAAEKIDLKKIRFISDEDQADVLGVELLQDTAYTHGVSDLMISLVESDFKKECKMLVENGEEPQFGVLFSGHHHRCWRYWRAKRVELRIFQKGL